MEILAPAGDLKILKVAIQAGCDAVYISGKNFGARKSAPNFDLSELIDAIDYAHLRGVKVYVTINTIVFDNEFAELHGYLDFLYNNKVDAIIIQDLGVLSYVRTHFPNLIVHASTQMNIHNVRGAKQLMKLGVRRVILARETSITEIKKIIDLGIEVEVFGHGALCYAYSGNCLMSYMIGGRSGNRGECAQPCRKKYSLVENNKMIGSACSLLSMKDLNTLGYIEELSKAGVASLKIEGRMKSAAYVYTVVNAYRKKLDGLRDNNDIDNLKCAFNREFTKGYMFNESNNEVMNFNGVNHQGLLIGKVKSVSSNGCLLSLNKSLCVGDAIRIKGSKETGFYVQNLENRDNSVYIPGRFNIKSGDLVYKTIDGIKVKEAEESLNTERYCLNLLFKVSIHLNELLTLEIKYKDIMVIVSTIKLVETANQPMSIDRIMQQLKKTGDKLFEVSKIIVDYDHLAFVRISDLNALRREALEKFKISFLETYNIPSYKPLLNIENDHKTINDHQVHFDFVVQNQFQYEWCLNNGFKDVYPVFDNNEMMYARHFNTLELKAKKNIVHNFGDFGENQILSPSCNICNVEALKFVDSYGVDTIYLSNELSKNEKLKLAMTYTKAAKGVFIYGHMEVMSSKGCFINKQKNINRINCGSCKHNNYKIIDEYDNEMFVNGRCNEDGPEISIYSYKLFDELKYVNEYIKKGINHFLIVLTDESIKELGGLKYTIERLRG